MHFILLYYSMTIKVLFRGKKNWHPSSGIEEKQTYHKYTKKRSNESHHKTWDVQYNSEPHVHS